MAETPERQYRMAGELVPESKMPQWHHARGLPWGKDFNGPYPITISRQVRPHNMPVHLANEHGWPGTPSDGEMDMYHALAHMYGWYRPGQGHYHEKPERLTRTLGSGGVPEDLGEDEVHEPLHNPIAPAAPGGPTGYCRRCASSGVGVCDDYPNCPAGAAAHAGAASRPGPLADQSSGEYPPKDPHDGSTHVCDDGQECSRADGLIG